jgi:hypothetical protein
MPTRKLLLTGSLLLAASPAMAHGNPLFFFVPVAHLLVLVLAMGYVLTRRAAWTSKLVSAGVLLVIPAAYWGLMFVPGSFGVFVLSSTLMLGAIIAAAVWLVRRDATSKKAVR